MVVFLENTAKEVLPKTIYGVMNSREKIENIIENSLKLLFKWMMMETPGMEKIISSDLVPNRPK